MKAIRKLSVCQIAGTGSAILLLAFLTIPANMFSQERTTVTGILLDKENNQSVPYAYVSLYRCPDSTLVNVVVSDTSGKFTITRIYEGKYRLLINVLGYNSLEKQIEVRGNLNYDAGTLFLDGQTVRLNEAVVSGERIKAKAEGDRTTFFISKKMIDASANGTDLLRLIPGVQIDIMQNISLEGNRNILILVDGKERDRNFVGQINPRQIEKVEVISAPPSKYDASYSGVINIITKTERDSGISGQINPEIPLSSSFVYAHPSGNLNYGFKKVNFYISYNGELINADIHESVYRKITGISGVSEIRSDQYVRQKYWSHRINYGFDYFLNPRNQINFYAFYNPYSRELDGRAELQNSSKTDSQWQRKKVDNDINRISYYSVYYKHLFNEKGNEIVFDVNSYLLKAENATSFIPVESDNSDKILISSVKPRQNASSLKVDYNAFPGKELNFSIGGKARIQTMHDANSHDFNYSDYLFAVYGSLGYKHSKIDMNIGVRAENSVLELDNKFNTSFLSVLPYGAINLKLSSVQSLQLTYSRSISRPNIYQLNPSTLTDDPYSVRMGNALLTPELHTAIYLEHSIRFNNNYLATRLFYNRVRDAINNLTFVNDTAAFETRVYNLGTINQYGIQLTGALKLGKIISFNPYFKIFRLNTAGNGLAKQFEVGNRHQLEFESGLSAVFSFRHDYSLSLVFQYSSPNNYIQGNYFCDALYFISFEKTFKKKFKAGIVCGIPFARSFVYNGSEITGADFYSYYTGTIKIPAVPLSWIRLSYQFHSGKKRDKIERTKEEIDNLPKKGF